MNKDQEQAKKQARELLSRAVAVHVVMAQTGAYRQYQHQQHRHQYEQYQHQHQHQEDDVSRVRPGALAI